MDQLQLERALRAMQEEHALVHSSSQTKLSEANALVDGIEEKSSVINKKLHDAESKLAEVNRKSAELDMKLRELEVRESLLHKERLSVATEYVPCSTLYEYMLSILLCDSFKFGILLLITVENHLKQHSTNKGKI